MFSSMGKQSKQQVDLGDFMTIIENNRAERHLEKRERLREDVHPHGGALIRRLIEAIDAGRTILLP